MQMLYFKIALFICNTILFYFHKKLFQHRHFQKATSSTIARNKFKNIMAAYAQHLKAIKTILPLCNTFDTAIISHFRSYSNKFLANSTQHFNIYKLLLASTLFCFALIDLQTFSINFSFLFYF